MSCTQYVLVHNCISRFLLNQYLSMFPLISVILYRPTFNSEYAIIQIYLLLSKLECNEGRGYVRMMLYVVCNASIKYHI